MTKTLGRKIFPLILISLGTAILALGIVAINIPNGLAEGGLTGITLILRFWFGIDPAYSTILLNIPLIIIGYRYLGRTTLFYTIWGTLSLSFFLFIWQRISIISQLNLEHDLFIASLLAGLIGGFGAGIVVKNGGTTGGTDIVAKILERKFHIPIGKSFLGIDFFVLLASLSYIDIKHMIYTLVASFVYSRVVTIIENGSYAERGFIIISDQYENIGKMIDLKLNRGFTYLEASGGYQNNAKKIIYSVVSQNEVSIMKDLIRQEDPHAFFSVVDVQEVYGEGFTYDSPPLINQDLKNTHQN